MDKKIVSVLGGSGLLAVAWLGSSVYVNQQTDAQIKALVDKVAKGCVARIHDPQHQQLLFSTHGQFELHVGDQCNTDKDLRDLLVVNVDYKTSSLILPNALTRFEWTLKQQSHDQDNAGTLLELSGEGATRLTGGVYSSIKSQAFTGYFDEGSWRMEPLAGDVEWRDNALLFNLKTPRLVGRGGGDAVDIQGIGVHADLSDTRLSIGNSDFTIDKISTSQGFAQGIGISTVTSQNADRLDSQVVYALNAFNAMGYEGQDLKVELGINGLHAPSIKTLMELSQDSASIQNLTVEEDQKYRSAIRELINQGLTVSLAKLAGTVKHAADTSSLDGHLKIVIKPNPAQNKSIQLANVLESWGDVILKGNVLADEQKTQFAQMGAAIVIPEGLKASYEYSAGILKANERVIEQQAVQASLQEFDTTINAFLSKPIKDSLNASGIDDAAEEADVSDYSADQAEALVSMTITGFTTVGPTDSMLEDANGNRVYFESNSDIGRQIMQTCQEGSLCVVTGMVDTANQYQYLRQLQAVAQADQAEATDAAPAEVPVVESEPVQPSFDCGKASNNVEQLICSSSELAAADLQLSQLYRQAIAGSPAAEAIVAEQKIWLKNVRGACSDAECLQLAYQLRIRQLASK